MTTTKSQAQTNDIVLNAGAPASYFGVLVSPDRYKLLSINTRENDYLTEYISKHGIDNYALPKISLFSVDGYALIITVGSLAFLGGLIIGLRL